jgi:hypothetical protein
MMKLTVDIIKRLIKEELEEFKGAKPVRTMGLEFKFMLDGTVHIFDNFNINKIQLVTSRTDLTDEEKLNAAATNLVPCEGVDWQGYRWRNWQLNGERAYSFFVSSKLLDQVPEVKDIPVAHKELIDVKAAYKKGTSKGYNPLSFTIHGGKHDGGSLSIKLTPEKERWLDDLGKDEDPEKLRFTNKRDWDEDDPDDED